MPAVAEAFLSKAGGAAPDRASSMPGLPRDIYEQMKLKKALLGGYSMRDGSQSTICGQMNTMITART